MTEIAKRDHRHRAERRLPREIERYLNITGLQALSKVLGADSPALTGFRPEQAGLIQLVRWTGRSSVLFWNWPGLVAARALIDDGHEVHIYDERESYREAARALCREEAQVLGLSDPESEALTTIQNLPGLDKIFISTPMFDKIGAQHPLIRLLIDTLNRRRNRHRCAKQCGLANVSSVVDFQRVVG
ncbi:MAG: hypothetical protein ACJ0TD_03760 [Arenicellales bacterium]